MDSTYSNLLINASAEYDDKISTIADKYRQEVLIPFCKEKKLEFFSGNGTFFFTGKDGRCISTTYDVIRMRGTTRRQFEDIFSLLNTEVRSHNDLFSYYVSDIREK